jgi:molecular chaperone GrpE (heat shock protein)
MMGLYIKQLQDNHSKESKEFADALEGVKLVLEQLKTILERRGQ